MTERKLIKKIITRNSGEADQAWKRGRQNRSAVGSFGILLLVLFVAVFMFFPFYLALIQSFKPMNELFYFPPRLYILRPTVRHYRMISALSESFFVPMTRYAFNSALVAVTVTVGNVLIASLAAYPFAKGDFPGKNGLWRVIMASLVFYGGVALGFTRYLVMAYMGIINTYLCVILPPLAETMGLFLMKQFMGEIPDAMIDSSRIDGATEFMTFRMIVAPLVKPAILTLSIFSFSAAWGNASPLIYTENLKALPAALMQIAGANVARQGVSAAASVLVVIPPAVFFLLAQSSVIQTMSHSGIKG